MNKYMADLSKFQSDLNEFFSLLQEVSSSGVGTPGQLRDLGLIVIDDTLEVGDAEEITRFLAGDYIFYRLDSSNYSDDFIKKLTEANSKELPFIVDCQTDPSSEVLQILHQLSEDNRFTISEDGGLKSILLNPKASIAFVVTSSVLEEKITHPYFQSLFGPVLRLQ